MEVLPLPDPDPVRALLNMPERMRRAMWGNTESPDRFEAAYEAASPKTYLERLYFDAGYLAGVSEGAWAGLKELRDGVVVLFSAAADWALARGEQTLRYSFLDIATGRLWDGRVHAQAERDLKAIGELIEATWEVLKILLLLPEWVKDNPGAAIEIYAELNVVIAEVLGDEMDEWLDEYKGLSDERFEQGRFVGHFAGAILFEIGMSFIPPLRPLRAAKLLRLTP